MYIFKTESISKLSNNLIFSGQNLVPEWFKYHIFLHFSRAIDVISFITWTPMKYQVSFRAKTWYLHMWK